MKRILSIALCLLCGWFIAQAQYRIFSCSGKIQYKTASSTSKWAPAEKNVLLADADLLKLTNGSVVCVEYIPRHQLYRWKQTGTLSVEQLVEKAKQENARHIAKSLNRDISSGNKQPMTLSMDILGAGTRAFNPFSTEEGSYTMEELAEELAWIGAKACSGAESPKVEGLVLTRFDFGDVLDFEFSNATDKDYHMNVLHVNKSTKSASLCYVVTPEVEEYSCPVTPSGFCTCAMDLLFPNTEDDIYVLVALENPYDSYALDNELKKYSIDNAKEHNINIQYIW
ncbi:MAG: hypothetical protein J5704_02660 [Paludibacteraceae bacterium]|nr:hypothetical protein [Paludibacteraceae bacterium]